VLRRLCGARSALSSLTAWRARRKPSYEPNPAGPPSSAPPCTPRGICAECAAAGLVGGVETVCAYVPIGSEPGSIDLVDSLLRCGVRYYCPSRAATQPRIRYAGLGEYRPAVSSRHGSVARARSALALPMRSGRGGNPGAGACGRSHRGSARARRGFLRPLAPLADPAARLSLCARQRNRRSVTADRMTCR